MTLNIKYSDFYRKHVIRTISKLRSPLINQADEIFLPRSSIIHYLPETDQEIGIDRSHSLMRNVGDRVLIYHLEKLKVELGKVTPVPTNINKLIRQYHRKHLTIQKVRNIEKSLLNDRLHLIVNYALLPRLNKYVNNPLLIYQEWFNKRLTLWENIKDLGDIRFHFIRFTMPKFLPSKSELRRFAKTFTKPALENFHEDSTLDLLELWRIVSEDVESINLGIDENIIQKINLVFIESGNIAIINLQDLINWSVEDPSATPNALYAFFEQMMGFRSAIDSNVVTKDLQSIDPLPISGESIISNLILEQASNGSLSTAEQKGLAKLSQKFKTIPNPITGEGTLADMVVTNDDLKIVQDSVIQDNITIHDKSVLFSSIKEMDSLYVKKVLHKDIIQSILSIQNGGLIVKDVKVKRKNNVANKIDIYSVQIQPIAGASSTIKFTLPVIEEDGTFFANGIKYRMDRQRGD